MLNNKEYYEYDVDYNKIKLILEQCVRQGNGLDFIVDYNKLCGLLTNEQIPVTPFCFNLASRVINGNDVPLLESLYKGSRLESMTQYRAIADIMFIRDDVIDETASVLLSNLKMNSTDNPGLDKINCASKLYADYACYVASIVGGYSLDEKRKGLLDYRIACKANTKCIQKDNYEYRNKDIG